MRAFAKDWFYATLARLKRLATPAAPTLKPPP